MRQNQEWYFIKKNTFLTTNSFTYIFLPAVVLLTMVAVVQAQDSEVKEYELDEICVTATRMKRKTVEVPAAITIVDEKTIDNKKMFNVKEALIGIPGVLIDSKNQGYDARLMIRGAGLKARYGVRDIMVLMDGAPLTDPDSLTRLDFIDTQLIQQIEVVKGPNSTLWGANAAGGVINITTKSPYEEVGSIAKMGMGNFGAQSYHLSCSDEIKETLYYTLGGSHRRSDNSWRRWNEFRTSQGSLQTAILFEDESSWESYFGYTNADLQLPGKLNQEQFERYEDTKEAKETDGPWQFSGRYSESFFLTSRFSKEVGPWEFKPMVFVNKWNHEHPVTGRINDADTLTYGADLQADYRHPLVNGSGTLIMGATIRFDEQDTDYFKYRDFTSTPSGRILEVLSDERGDLIEQQSRDVKLYGIYTQESYCPSDRWVIDFGLRFDRVEFDITGTRTEEYDYALGQYVPAGDPTPVQKDYQDISPRIGASYRIWDGFNIYGTVAKGIQTPTEGELNENADLDLVNIFNYEIGLKMRRIRWHFDAALYYSEVEGDVVQVIQPDNHTQYINAGQTNKLGFEFAGACMLTHELEIGASYAYSDYTYNEFTEPVRTGMNVDNVDRSDNQLPFIPNHHYSIYADYRHPSGFKGSIASHSWGSYYIDNANSEKYEGYNFVTELMIGYEQGAFDITLNVDNLFDKQYAVEVQKDTQGKKLYNPATPASYMIRVSYRF